MSSQPAKIKDYPIIRIIGKGGMGEVYLAKHPTLKQEIILKKLSIRDRDASERFLKEAKIMLELRHENVVQVFDHFKEGNSTFIAMEYVKGKALNQIIQENGAIPIPLALFILYQTALGLHHAHTRKVIHRDIKPHNILISTNGNTKLTDFGIAKRPEEEKDNITREGTFIGTPAYMAPEQFSEKGRVSFQSDIYSLGVVFYEMITGVRAFKNEFSAEVINCITKGKCSPASRYLKKLPVIVKGILKKTFTIKPKKRYKNLLPLIKLLRNYFRKYNVFEIRDSIKRLLLGDKKLKKSAFFQNFERQKKAALIYRLVFSSVFILLLIIILFFSTNRYYEWFKANRYGKIVVKFDRGNLSSDNIFIGIDDKYQKANFSRDYFKYLRDRFNKKNKKKKINIDDYIENKYSKSFYLREGEHDISVVSGSYKNFKSIYILSRFSQKRENASDNSQIVDIPIEQPKFQDVSVYFRFWDSITQKPLFAFEHYNDISLSRYRYEDDNLKIFFGNKLMKLKDYILKKKEQKLYPFYSGYRYVFYVDKFEKNGIAYESKKFDFKFSREDRTVFIHTSLTPLPCKVVIKSNVEKVPVYINDSDAGPVFEKGEYVYKKYRLIKTTKKADMHYREILIPPQEFQIKIARKGRVIKKYLKNDENFELEVNFSDGKYSY